MSGRESRSVELAGAEPSPGRSEEQYGRFRHENGRQEGVSGAEKLWRYIYLDGRRWKSREETSRRVICEGGFSRT